jgi:hypothetical protein
MYYVQINSMRESFVLPPPDDLKIQTPSQYRFCLDQRPLGSDQTYYSTNQALADASYTSPRITGVQQQAAGDELAGNPKTRIQPVTVAPIYANDYWAGDFVVAPGINNQTMQELFLSGYVGTSTCGDTRGMEITPVVPTVVPTHINEKYVPSPPHDRRGVVEPYKHAIIEPFAFDQKAFGVERATPGDVLGCSYDPEQLAHNLPSNSTNGACQLNKAYDGYNKNLYTQIIQPGVYARQETIEPIQSNMGITWTQQFEPVRCETDRYGNRTFVSQDPRQAVAPAPIVHAPRATESNVYDPRHTGYGSQFRQYLDPMTGQPRFYYDDVDAIRRPNYIVRSNVDAFPWADKPDAMTSENTASQQFSHALAQKQFLDDSLSFRTDLQERYMRKYNNEVGWQRRQAPMHTMGGRGR